MSRLRSAPAAKAKPAAARPAGRQVMIAKPKSDVFVTLLGVSLAAILIGCILLALVLKQYNFETKAAMNTTTGPVATALA